MHMAVVYHALERKLPPIYMDRELAKKVLKRNSYSESAAKNALCNIFHSNGSALLENGAVMSRAL